ncbi:GNAT family N-acetyltransferase [Kutzneria kofuensis]|jgi:GNAT superfamily N-acetyltransferase|uniref:GNAT superfamily N-acetyltransferase n=1 Tax=Kutzneria kofuensis TaxID=103725 RepID=A0A7W9KE91_9PSEU|nr:GNAT family N-acetyltransferase [Kutzneria kofuensis]MBB5890926.1 GNAT superfamily N-acetyltransferase [Kutzneria kofuensis]
MRLRRATADDLDTVGALFDDAVRWLTEQGRTGQWGTEPFSTVPKRVETMRRWLAGEAWIAEVGARAAGFAAFGEPQAHIPPSDVPELYVSGLVGARFPEARGAGRMLLKHAETRAAEQGVERVRVDCYAGDDRALVAFYVSAGFTPTDTFTVGTWPGQVLELRLR